MWMFIVVSCFPFISTASISSILSFVILPFLLIDSSILCWPLPYFADNSLTFCYVIAYVTLLLSPFTFGCGYLFLSLFAMFGPGFSMFVSIVFSFFFDGYRGFASLDLEACFLLTTLFPLALILTSSSFSESVIYYLSDFSTACSLGGGLLRLVIFFLEFNFLKTWSLTGGYSSALAISLLIFVIKSSPFYETTSLSVFSRSGVLLYGSIFP